MKLEEYRSILGHLPIKCPTPEAMAMVCPHLSQIETVETFLKKGYIAVPGLLVKNAVHILHYSHERLNVIDNGKKKNIPPVLDYAFTVRFQNDECVIPKESDNFSYSFAKKAVEFANKNWGDQLIEDTWNSVMRIVLQDPTDLVNDRYHNNYPRTKRVLYTALDRDINDIANDLSAPEHVLQDRSIVVISEDKFSGFELQGDKRGIDFHYNCAYCGGGLGIYKCFGCGNTFSDDQMRSGSRLPLSSKIVMYFIEHGHNFAIDPVVAQIEQEQEWKKYVER